MKLPIFSKESISIQVNRWLFTKALKKWVFTAFNISFLSYQKKWVKAFEFTKIRWIIYIQIKYKINRCEGKFLSGPHKNFKRSEINYFVVEFCWF